MEYDIKGEFEDGKPEVIFCRGKRAGHIDGDKRRFMLEGRAFRVSGFLTLTCRDERTGKELGSYRKSVLNHFWDAGDSNTLTVLGQRYSVQRHDDATKIVVRDAHGKEVLVCKQDDDDEIEVAARFSAEDIREEHKVMLCLVFFAYYTDKRWSE